MVVSRLRILGVFFFALALGLTATTQCFAILGGVDATGNPIVVGILSDEKATRPQCSGALVAPRIVFTAAHCLYTDPSKFWIAQPGVSIGDLSIPRIQAERFLIPQDFSSKTFPYQNDFGIIILKSSFNGFKTVAYASLEDIKKWSESSDAVTHVGYGCTALVEKPPCGLTSQTPNQFNTTLEREVPQQFNSLKPNTFSMTKISVDKTICGGDSGSPLLKFQESNWIYIGAQSSSNGAGCTPNCEVNCVATQGIPAANLSLVNEAFSLVGTPKSDSKATDKLVTITCIKGKQVRKVSGVMPSCPKGFKKK